MLKPLFIFLGTVSLGFGIAGIIIPGLPATPFLLLTAGLYVRSSQKLYGLLIGHRILGPYISNYSGGMSKKLKITAILIMWTMISISAFILLENSMIRIILLFAGVIGTILVVLFPSGDKLSK